MKVEIDFTDEITRDVLISELKEMRGVVNGPWWDTDDKERDLAAIDLVLSWYHVRN